MKVLLFSSNVIVTNTGKFEFSLAAKTAAFVSNKSVIVSITITSASFPARISSLKISYASSKLKLPVGSRSCPIGPISSATKLSLPSHAFLPFSIAFFIISSVEYPVPFNLYLFAPNVFA